MTGRRIVINVTIATLLVVAGLAGIVTGDTTGVVVGSTALVAAIVSLRNLQRSK